MKCPSRRLSYEEDSPLDQLMVERAMSPALWQSRPAKQESPKRRYAKQSRPRYPTVRALPQTGHCSARSASSSTSGGRRLGLDFQCAWEASPRLALARREQHQRPEHLALMLVALDPA